MSEVVSLIIPFIALILISTALDVLITALQNFMSRIPKLPDHFEPWLAYLLVFFAAYLIFWQGNFDIFRYLEFQWNREWQGHFLTAIFLTSGSRMLRTSFNLINDIPSPLRGVNSTIKNVVSNLSNTKLKESNTKKDEPIDYNKLV